MKWTEVKIKTTPEASDAVCEMLMSVGAGGVSIEDPNDIRAEISKAGSLDYADDNFLNNLGDDVVIKAYFNESMNKFELADLIKEKLSYISNFLDTGEGYAGYTEVDDEDWSTVWKKYYKPFNLTEKVVIKPTWEEYSAKEGEIIIELDPGMAFGTGTHETTRMCSILLEEYLKPGDTVIDVGCGTGILAIIAAKLGAEKITAVDIDEVAVRVTKENCELNKVGNGIESFRGVMSDIPRRKSDIVIANIIANVIIDISVLIPYYVKTEGLFITSGIIRERRQEVVETYEKLGFKCLATEEMGEWVAIVFKCQDSL